MPKIYLISPETITDLDFFLLELEAIFVLEERPAVFQLRLKGGQNTEDMIIKTKSLCEKYGVEFILNDDIPLAIKYDVGVHVGIDDASLEEILEFKKTSTRSLGISCYSDINRALQFADVASYVAFGAMFSSSTKSSAPKCSIETVEEFCKISKAKVAVIGGINAKNIKELSPILHCISYVCVISSVW